MQEQMDAERIERIQRRTEENYHLVSLPPRMAEHEREREQREMEEQMYQRANPNVKPRFMANPIPDFERLQRNFQDTLDEKRKSKRPTEPQPFAFQETRVSLPIFQTIQLNLYRKGWLDIIWISITR